MFQPMAGSRFSVFGSIAGADRGIAPKFRASDWQRRDASKAILNVCTCDSRGGIHVFVALREFGESCWGSETNYKKK